jgi:hypothetical protein
MTNWLKLKLRDWVNSAQDIEDRNYVSQKMATTGAIGIGRSPSIDNDRGIRFQVYKANGGMVVETSMYDRHKDRHHNSLHIITDEQDLGKEIGKIITMETLKI